MIAVKRIAFVFYSLEPQRETRSLVSESVFLISDHEFLKHADLASNRNANRSSATRYPGHPLARWRRKLESMLFWFQHPILAIGHNTEQPLMSVRILRSPTNTHADGVARKLHL